jgi:hypothetical protein
MMGLALAACGSDNGEDKSDDGNTPSASDSGNDFAGGSVDEIKEAAITDMKALESMTLDGSITLDGEELEMSLSMDTAGNCVGKMSQSDGTAEFLGVEGDYYLKGDEAFWRSNSDPGKADATIEAVGDNWVKLGPDAGGFSDVCDLDSMIEDLEDDVDDEGKQVSKGDETTVDGASVVEVVTQDGKETTTTLVATDEKHYILEVTNEGGDEPGSFTLSDFDEPVDAEAPAETDVVEMPGA